MPSVGAGGLGDIIVRGTNATNGGAIILAGALPTALMAIISDLVLGFLERRLEPKRQSRILNRHEPYLTLKTAIAGRLFTALKGSFSKSHVFIVLFNKTATESVRIRLIPSVSFAIGRYESSQMIEGSLTCEYHFLAIAASLLTAGNPQPAKPSTSAVPISTSQVQPLAAPTLILGRRPSRHTMPHQCTRNLPAYRNKIWIRKSKLHG